MPSKLFVSCTTIALLGLVACGSNAHQAESSESSTAEATNSASASVSPSSTSTVATSSASASNAETASSEPSPEATSEAAVVLAEPGTDCGLAQSAGAQNHIYVFGGQVSCDEAVDVMQSFLPSMTDGSVGQARAQVALGDYTCQESDSSSRITGAYATCTNPVNNAYIQLRSGIVPIPGPVADTSQYYSTVAQSTYDYGFAPAGASMGTFGCGINMGGLGVVCETAQTNGAVAGNPIGGYVKTWKVTMNPSAGVVVEEGGLQGPSETTSQSTALDVGTVINFNGVSCQAVSADSIKCIGTDGAGFTISPDGVIQP